MGGSASTNSSLSEICCRLFFSAHQNQVQKSALYEHERLLNLQPVRCTGVESMKHLQISSVCLEKR